LPGGVQVKQRKVVIGKFRRSNFRDQICNFRRSFGGALSYLTPKGRLATSVIAVCAFELDCFDHQSSRMLLESRDLRYLQNIGGTISLGRDSLLAEEDLAIMIVVTNLEFGENRIERQKRRQKSDDRKQQPKRSLSKTHRTKTR